MELLVLIVFSIYLLLISYFFVVFKFPNRIHCVHLLSFKGYFLLKTIRLKSGVCEKQVIAGNMMNKN